MNGLHVTLSWNALARDNEKYGVYRGRMLLTSKYRDAKRLAHEQARMQCRGASPLTARLKMVCRLYEPDRRVRDIVNYAKMVQDALRGTIYEDDSQVDNAEWVRAGVDKDHPRLEVSVFPLSPSPLPSEEPQK